MTKEKSAKFEWIFTTNRCKLCRRFYNDEIPLNEGYSQNGTKIPQDTHISNFSGIKRRKIRQTIFHLIACLREYYELEKMREWAWWNYTETSEFQCLEFRCLTRQRYEYSFSLSKIWSSFTILVYPPVTLENRIKNNQIIEWIAYEIGVKSWFWIVLTSLNDFRRTLLNSQSREKQFFLFPKDWYMAPTVRLPSTSCEN